MRVMKTAADNETAYFEVILPALPVPELEKLVGLLAQNNKIHHDHPAAITLFHESGARLPQKSLILVGRRIEHHLGGEPPAYSARGFE